MNIKLISNNLKEIFEEIIPFAKGNRGVIRSARYFSNISYIELKSIVNSGNIDLIIDVGANRGQFFSSLRNTVKYKRKVVSFEPNPDLVPALEAASKTDSDWKIFPYALGAEESFLSFNIYEDSKLSSFLGGTGENSERFKDKFKIERTIEVPVKTLDSFFDMHEDKLLENSVFLKLDTQGFDLEVLRGLKKNIKRIKYIQSEISVIPIYSGMAHYTTSINAFEEAGYKLLSLIPVTRERKTGFVIEFDALWGR